LGFISYTDRRMVSLEDTEESAYNFLNSLLSGRKIEMEEQDILEFFDVFVHTLFRAIRVLKRIAPQAVSIVGGKNLLKKDYLNTAYDLAMSFNKDNISVLRRGDKGVSAAVVDVYKDLRLARKLGNAWFISLKDGERRRNGYFNQQGKIYLQYNTALEVAMQSASNSGFVFFPGGIDTLNLLFSTLCLIQTIKIQPVPIVLVGKDFWSDLDSWIRDVMIREGTVSKWNLSLYRIVGSAREAKEAVFDFTNRYSSLENKKALPSLIIQKECREKPKETQESSSSLNKEYRFLIYCTSSTYNLTQKV